MSNNKHPNLENMIDNTPCFANEKDRHDVMMQKLKEGMKDPDFMRDPNFAIKVR